MKGERGWAYSRQMCGSLAGNEGFAKEIAKKKTRRDDREVASSIEL